MAVLGVGEVDRRQGVLGGLCEGIGAAGDDVIGTIFGDHDGEAERP